MAKNVFIYIIYISGHFGIKGTETTKYFVPLFHFYLTITLCPSLHKGLYSIIYITFYYIKSFEKKWPKMFLFI